MTDPGELLRRKESLDDAFEPFTFEDPNLGLCIKHPLVFSIMHHEVLNATMNAMLRQKQKAVEAALREQRYSSYIILHERPWRFEAFSRVADLIPQDEYWILLREVWTDSENIWQNEAEWREVLTSDAPHQERIMELDDYRQLLDMPDTIIIYRGFHAEGRHMGLSWTIDREKAEWFAMRFQHCEPTVFGGAVSRHDVIAYLTSRGEDEIIVLPENVRMMRPVQISPQSAKTSGRSDNGSTC
jgi:hypothetical protein